MQKCRQGRGGDLHIKRLEQLSTNHNLQGELTFMKRENELLLLFSRIMLKLWPLSPYPLEPHTTI